MKISRQNSLHSLLKSKATAIPAPQQRFSAEPGLQCFSRDGPFALLRKSGPGHSRMKRHVRNASGTGAGWGIPRSDRRYTFFRAWCFSAHSGKVHHIKFSMDLSSSRQSEKEQTAEPHPKEPQSSFSGESGFCRIPVNLFTSGINKSRTVSTICFGCPALFSVYFRSVRMIYTVSAAIPSGLRSYPIPAE